jgi:NADH:ubiquinone oxidoreductase subunit 4 (subunit M)
MVLTSDLTWIILLPVIGSIAAFTLPTQWARWVALGAATATFALTLVVFFRILAGGQGFGDLQHLQDSVSQPWINFQAGS